MRKRKRDTEVLPLIEKYMPAASDEDKLAASAELWLFFDGFFELFSELERRGYFEARDKSQWFDSLYSGEHSQQQI